VLLRNLYWVFCFLWYGSCCFNGRYGKFRFCLFWFLL